MKNGDTLYSIGRKFNISVDELKKINNLVSNNLSIGQKLKLNNKQNQNDPIYIVQRGDTLYSISKNNNVSIEDIIEANNLTSNVLSIGQELYIPSENEVIENHPEIKDELEKLTNTITDSDMAKMNYEVETYSVLACKQRYTVDDFVVTCEACYCNVDEESVCGADSRAQSADFPN